MSTTANGFRALVATQALSAFNHNQLRSALLTLVAFRPLDTSGMSSETIIALSTLFIVSPYALLSIPGGRLADRLEKARLIKWVKAFEIAVFTAAGVGLMLMSVPVLLLAILLAGVEAALFGPAKFGILPELLSRDKLIAGNSWVSATSTVAILAGLITGNLMIVSGVHFAVIALGGIAIAALGWLLCLAIPVTAPRAPQLELRLQAFLADFGTCFRQLAKVPAVIFPVLGCSWFWFQGAANTSLIPLYAAETGSLPEAVVSLLLIACSLGIAAGAIGARWLAATNRPSVLPLAAFLVIAVPGLDLWWAGPIDDAAGVARATADFFVLAAGCGLYAVPLTTAVQQLTPDDERARFVGVNHTLNGAAMMGSGFVVLLLNLPGLSVGLILGITALVSSVIAAFALLTTLPALTGVRATDTAPLAPRS